MFCFVLVLGLAINVISRTAFDDQFIEKTSPKAALTTPISSSHIAIVNETRRDQVLILESHKNVELLERLAAEQPCGATQAITLAPVSETIV